MTNDHTHFLARTGDILTARGFTSGSVRSVPIYFSDPCGDREMRGQRFSKFVDEFCERYRERHPSLVNPSAFGDFASIPESEVMAAFDPFEVFDRAYGGLSEMERGCVDALCHFVPREDIGHIGSRLVGFGGPTADLDLLIRGVDNLHRMAAAMADYVALCGGVIGIERTQFEKSVRKYERLYNSAHNTFHSMIANRWSTICIPGRLFAKLRFTYDPRRDRLPEVPSPVFLEPRTISGKVENSTTTAMMPRRFAIVDDRDVRWDVVTYFWDYSYCVGDGDIVTIRGRADDEGKTIVLGERTRDGIVIRHAANPTCPVL